MREVAPGDLVFSFIDTRISAIGIAQSYCWESPKPLEFGQAGQNWEDIGWRVKVRFTELVNTIRPKDHIELLRPLLPARYSPLQPNGNGAPRSWHLGRPRTRSEESMDPIGDARREVGLEIQKLAEEFERSDEAAFRRTRLVCWAVVAVVTIIVLILLITGGDGRYLAASWVAVTGLTWGGYALSSRRQRQQTGRLRALATRWLNEVPPALGRP